MWSHRCASRVQLGDLGLQTLQEELRDRLTVCASALAGRRTSWGYGFSFRCESMRAHLSGEHRDCLAGIAVRKLDRPWNAVRLLRVQFEAQVCARSCASLTSSYSTLLYSTLLYSTPLHSYSVLLCSALTSMSVRTPVLNSDLGQVPLRTRVRFAEPSPVGGQHRYFDGQNRRRYSTALHYFSAVLHRYLTWGRE